MFCDQPTSWSRTNNEVNHFWFVTIELAEFSHLGLLSFETSPEPIVGLTVQAFERVAAIAPGDKGDYTGRRAVLNLNHGSSEWFVVTIGDSPGQATGRHLGCAQTSQKEEADDRC